MNPPPAGLPYLDAERLRRALPVADAIDALEDAFGAERLPECPVRVHHRAQGGELLLMPAWGDIGIGVKLITIDAANPERGLPLLHGVFVLFSADGKAPLAVLDGTALTSIRTAAVSALGVRHLARADAHALLVFGAGVQARAHVEAMLEVRDFQTAVIVDPAAERAEALAARACELGLDARVGAAGDVAGADVVCCCTTSSEPVLHGADLAPGTHIAAMGAYRADLREVDVLTLRRSRVIVESREVALAEAGDLLIPIGVGEWAPEMIDCELADVVRGPGRRRDPEEITLLKTVGMASEDLVVARAAVAKLASGAASAAA